MVYINIKLKRKLATNLKDNIQLKKRLTELQTFLGEMEEKYVLGRLEGHLYEKYSEKYNWEIRKLEQEPGQKGFDSSNREKIVEKAISIAGTISQDWLSADFVRK